MRSCGGRGEELRLRSDPVPALSLASLSLSLHRAHLLPPPQLLHLRFLLALLCIAALLRLFRRWIEQPPGLSLSLPLLCPLGPSTPCAPAGAVAPPPRGWGWPVTGMVGGAAAAPVMATASLPLRGPVRRRGGWDQRREEADSVRPAPPLKIADGGAIYFFSRWFPGPLQHFFLYVGIGGSFRGPGADNLRNV